MYLTLQTTMSVLNSFIQNVILNQNFKLVLNEFNFSELIDNN